MILTPYANKAADDLAGLVEAGASLGTLLMNEAVGKLAGRAVAYGKGAIVA